MSWAAPQRRKIATAAFFSPAHSSACASSSGNRSRRNPSGRPERLPRNRKRPVWNTWIDLIGLSLEAILARGAGPCSANPGGRAAARTENAPRRIVTRSRGDSDRRNDGELQARSRVDSFLMSGFPMDSTILVLPYRLSGLGGLSRGCIPPCFSPWESSSTTAVRPQARRSIGSSSSSWCTRAPTPARSAQRTALAKSR
jgi:hypothetical protein